MKIKHLFLIYFALCGLVSCSKKIHPVTTAASVTNIDTIEAKKAVIKRKPKESLPRVISVNDLSAKKTVDGRYYYDLQGHRYWRNNKDGKYYLFNKTMYANEDFKPASIL
jgi:hypothetical protein